MTDWQYLWHRLRHNAWDLVGDFIGVVAIFTMLVVMMGAAVVLS